MGTLLIHPIFHISIRDGIHVLRKGSLRLLITYLPAAGSLPNSLCEYLLDFSIVKEYVITARNYDAVMMRANQALKELQELLLLLGLDIPSSFSLVEGPREAVDEDESDYEVDNEPDVI